MRRLFLPLGLALAIVALPGCSDDGSAPGTSMAGNGGATGGSTSTGGSGGSTSTGGSGGSTSTGGSGGSTSTGGSGGSGGSSVSVDYCIEYCDADATKCPITFSTDYTNEAGCLTACAGLAADKLRCRINHLGDAQLNDAEHCVHGSKAGTGACE